MKTTTKSDLYTDATKTPHFDISVKTEYLVKQSDPEKSRYVFSYTVTIANNGAIAAQLLKRHWIITDANGETIEVRGEGVVGRQPWITPGDYYQYTSGTVLHEFMGCMEGSYTFCTEAGQQFDADIPIFTLAQPDKLN